MKSNAPKPSSHSSSASGASNPLSTVIRMLKNPKTWFLGIIVIALSALALQTWRVSQRFSKGETAYNSGNCDEALIHFGQLLNGVVPMDMDDWLDRSRARTGECDRFKSLVDDSSKQPLDAQILAATSFLDQYPQSSVGPQLRQLITDKTEGVMATKLATVAMCKRLHAVSSHNLLPMSEAQKPLMLQACGDSYSTAENFDDAIGVYETFLDQYANHEQAKAVKVSMAKAMVAQAKTQETGEIPPPPLSGYTGDSTTVVKIRNDSPEPMRIVLSGTDPQFKELGPCEDCETFHESPPKTCPEKGPETELVLAPGQYDVLVRSTGNRSITPFTGTWALGQGRAYYNCFYIVQPSGIPIQLD